MSCVFYTDRGTDIPAYIPAIHKYIHKYMYDVTGPKLLGLINIYRDRISFKF